MAEKTFNNVRFQFLYDTYDSWRTKNPTLKAGEIAIATIPNGGTPQENNTVTTPQVLIKVGDGSTPYNTLPFISGRAADVYSWAKASTKPTYTANEITNLGTFIGDYLANQNIVTDTDTQYRIYQDPTNKNKFTLQSKAKGAADSTFVAVSEITIPAYDDKEVRSLIGSVNTVVNGVSAVANAAQSEVTKIKTGETVVPKATQATNDGNGDPITETYATKTELNATNENVSANADAIDTLNGNESTEGSVLKTVKDEINAWANKVSADETINTFKEVIDYISDHGGEFNKLIGQVTDLDGRLDNAEGTLQTLPTNYVRTTDFTPVKTQVTTNADIIGKIVTGEQTVGKALKDGDGNVIKDTYATQEYAQATAGSVVALSERLGNIENGTTSVPKATNATNDEDGANIKNTYAKNDDLAAIAKTGNVNDLVQTTGDVIIFKCGNAASISNS